jgi:thioredoxin 2
MVAPELQKVAAANAGKLIVAKVNTDEVQDLGDRFRIRSIPTMAVFAGGEEVGRTSGARPANDILAFVQQSLASAHRHA